MYRKISSWDTIFDEIRNRTQHDCVRSLQTTNIAYFFLKKKMQLDEMIDTQ